MVPNAYVYETLNEANLEAALYVCCEVFVRDEPLGVHMGYTLPQVLQAARPFFEMCVNHKCDLSQVVRHGLGGPVVGVLLVARQQYLDQMDSAHLASVTSRNISVVMQCTSSLKQSFHKLSPTKLGKSACDSGVAYCMMRSVLSQHRGQGLAQEMHESMLNTAQHSGCKAVYSITTNIRSRALVQKFGGVEWDCVKYKEYTDLHGIKPFANMDMKLGDCANLMVTVIDAPGQS